MIAYDFDGNQGSMSSPMDLAFGLFKQVVIWNPDTKNTNMVVATNGKYDITAGASDIASNLAGKCTSPGVMLFQEDESYLKWYKQVATPFVTRLVELTDYDKGNTARLADKLSGHEKEYDTTPAAKPDDDDIRFESQNAIPVRKGILYYDRADVIIGYDKKYLTEELNELQYDLQSGLDKCREMVEPAVVGFGLFQKGNKAEVNLVARPNTFIRLGSRTILRAGLATFDIPVRKTKQLAYYMYLAALALWMWHRKIDMNSIKSSYETFVKDSIKKRNRRGNLTFDDYHAIASTIMLGLVGEGDTELTKTYNAEDIISTVLHMFGINYTLANRAMWDTTDRENWRRYQFLCFTLGFVMSRVKPFVLELLIQKYRVSDRSTAERMENANHGNFPGFGSLSGLHFLTPANDFQWQGKSSLPLPVIVDTTLKTGKSDAVISQKANYYDQLRLERKPSAFGSVEIVNGEIPPNVIDDTSMVQKRFTLRCANDARILETQLEERDVIRYIFPRRSLLPSDSNQDKARVSMFTIGLLTNGDRVLAEGYIIDPSMQFFEAATVKYYVNKYNETVVDKTDSATKGTQEPKPTAGMSGGKITVNGKKSSEAQPPPIPTPKEKLKVYETRDGEKKEESDTDTPSESGNDDRSTDVGEEKGE